MVKNHAIPKNYIVLNAGKILFFIKTEDDYVQRKAFKDQ